MKEVGILLKVGASGLEKIDQLGKGLRDAGVDTQALDKRAAELKAELDALTSKLGTATTAAEGMAGAEAKAEGDAKALTARVQALESEYDQLGRKLGVAAKSTDDVATAQARSATATTAAASAAREAAGALQAQGTAAEALDGKVAGAAKATADMAAAEAKAAGDAKALAGQVQSLEGEYDQLDRKLVVAAKGTADVAAAERQAATATTGAANAAREAAGAVQAQSASAEALGGKVTAAANATNDMAAAERKAAAEAKALAGAMQDLQQEFKGSQTSSDALGKHLDTAFRTLGVRSVQEVNAEIGRLKEALLTIKSADPFGPNIERAAQATKQRIKELETELQGVPAAANRARGGLEGLATAGVTAGASLEAATTRAVAMGAALLGISSAGQAAQSVLGTAAAFETLRVKLEQLLGSQKAATEAFEGIKKLAIDTPFEVKDLTESFIRLTNFGLKPTSTQMLALADTAAVAGGGTEALSRITLALGQAWAKTKLQGDEILQLTEAGVPVYDLLAKATGKNVVELQKLAEAGALGRDVIIKLFNALGEKNAGASAKLMATFSGAVSNAKDAMAEFFDLIGRSGALDYLNRKLQDALEEFQKLKDSGELERRAEAIAAAFVKFADGVGLAFDALKKLSTVLELLAAAYAAEKVLAYSKALLGIQAAAQVTTVATMELATAQRVAAAEGVATSAGVAGLGTRAAASAVSVGLLGRAMTLLSGLGVGALVLGVGELVGKFFEAKKAAEDGDEAVRKMLAGPPDGAQRAKGAIRDVNAELAEFKKNLPKLESDIAGVTGEGLAAVAKTTIENLRAVRASADEMGKALLIIGERAAKTLAIELPSQAAKASDGFKSVRAEADLLIGQLPSLGVKGKAAADVVAQALAKMIDAASTKRDFEIVSNEIKLMEKAGRIGPGAVTELLQQVKDKAQEVKDKVEELTPGIAGLREAARRAGVDVGELTTGVSEGFKKSVLDVKNLSAEIIKSGVSAERASPILADALDKRLQAAQTKEEVALVRAEIDKAALAGTLFGADLTRSLVTAKTKAEELSPAFRQAAADAKLLGVELQGAVKFTPEEGIRAFERLKASGKATAEEVTAAFINLANQQIKSANGVVPEWVKVQAELRGAVVTIDDTGMAVVKTLADAAKGASNLAGGLKEVGGAAKEAAADVRALNKDLLDTNNIQVRNANVASGPSKGSFGELFKNTASGGVTREVSSGQAVPPDNSGEWVYSIDPAVWTSRGQDAQGKPLPGGWYRPRAVAERAFAADVAAQRGSASPPAVRSPAPSAPTAPGPAPSSSGASETALQTQQVALLSAEISNLINRLSSLSSSVGAVPKTATFNLVLSDRAFPVQAQQSVADDLLRELERAQSTGGG